jgi:CRISPR-associated protein Cas6
MGEALATEASDATIDMHFALVGSQVMTDYALPLWHALRANLPWLVDEPTAGVHPLAGVSAGESGSGTVLHLGRRTRLILRLPRSRERDAHTLCGTRLDLGGEVVVGAAVPHPLRAAATQYSPFVALSCGDEASFVAECQSRLAGIDVSCAVLCGRVQAKRGELDEGGADATLHGYSVLLYGLSAEAAQRIQSHGLGLARKLGCGLFVPHKAVAAVGAF